MQYRMKIGQSGHICNTDIFASLGEPFKSPAQADEARCESVNVISQRVSMATSCEDWNICGVLNALGQLVIAQYAIYWVTNPLFLNKNHVAKYLEKAASFPSKSRTLGRVVACALW